MRDLLKFAIYRVPLVMPLLMVMLRKVQFALLSFYKDPMDVALLKQVYKERRLLLHPLEAYTILGFARMQSALPGDLAEVGVFEGASTRLIGAVKGDRTLWAFDTFEGLQDVSEDDTHGGLKFFRRGQYRSSRAQVEDYLAGIRNVRVVPGYFPESAGEAGNRRFSFVHLDVDTHDSTLAALRFFWPRLLEGGVIVTHDSHADGVARACRTFVAETNARTVSTTGSQQAFFR